MKVHSCNCGCGELIIQDNENRFKAFVNHAHRERAYRSRKRAEKMRSKIVGVEQRCLCCGDKFIARTQRHVFCSDSCRINHWQQMKRLEGMETE